MIQDLQPDVTEAEVKGYLKKVRKLANRHYDHQIEEWAASINLKLNQVLTDVLLNPPEILYPSKPGTPVGKYPEDIRIEAQHFADMREDRVAHLEDPPEIVRAPKPPVTPEEKEQMRIAKLSARQKEERERFLEVIWSIPRVGDL